MWSCQQATTTSPPPSISVISSPSLISELLPTTLSLPLLPTPHTHSSPTPLHPLTASSPAAASLTITGLHSQTTPLTHPYVLPECNVAVVVKLDSGSSERLRFCSPPFSIISDHFYAPHVCTAAHSLSFSGFLQIWSDFYGVCEGQLWRLVPGPARLNPSRELYSLT